MVVAMSSSPRSLRLSAVLATATAAVLSLAACSDGSTSGASSPAVTSTTSTATSTSTSSAPTTTTTTTSAPTTTSTAPTTSTKPTTTSAAPKPTASTATTPPPSTKFVNACVTANSKLNAAVAQWNAAVANGGDAKLDAAAKNFSTTATALMGLRTQASDRTFSLNIQAVASELNSMASARKNDKTVTTSNFNTKVAALRTYCQARLKA